MATYDDLVAAYAANPADLIAAVEALSPQERLDMIYAHAGDVLRVNRVDEDTYANLPREWRRLPVRWDHFDYILTQYDQSMLEHLLAPHLQLEIEGGHYLRDMLTLLVWKAYTEPVEAEEMSELTA